MTTPDTPCPPPDLPAEGGSWIRDPDGSLRRESLPKPEARRRAPPKEA